MKGSKKNLHGNELFALGSKSGGRDDKKTGISKPGSSSDPRKRDAPSTLGSVAKKAKLSVSSSVATKPDVPGSSSEYWEEIAIECESVDIISSVLQAMDQQDSERILALICGSIKSLISSKSKTNDSLLMLSLLYLAKIRPHIFCNETVTSALVSILKRDNQYAFKCKNNNTNYVLMTNLLARGYCDKKQWPELFMKTYVEDSINERLWVDSEESSYFTDNIIQAFGTKTPPKWILQPDSMGGTSKDGGASAGGMEEESMDSNNSLESSKTNPNDESTQPKFLQESVEKLIVDTIKDQFNRRQPPDCLTRNFLKFIATTCGLAEVRLLAVPRLELWIHNAKLVKPAQELLIYICYNITAQSSKDHDVLSQLVKMRLKTKQLINVYLASLKELINLQPTILPVMLKFVIQNELSNARNPNNMGILVSIFQTKPEDAAIHLAEIYQEFLLQREDCLRTLRVFLRELVKMLRYDINLLVFCKSLMSNRVEFVVQVQNFEFKERVCNAIADLVCLSMFLSVSPQIREAALAMRAGRDHKGSTVMYNYFSQVSQIQNHTLTWMHEMVPTVYKLNGPEFSSALNKILLLETPETYAKDQWPPEAERVSMLRMISEIPLHEDAILRVILIGISKEIIFTIPDTVEIVEQLVRRAGLMKFTDYPPLEMNKLDIIDFLFSMSEYHHPENIVLPPRYEPPKLAISSLYWKSWIILLILSAHNPSTFGSFCWQQYPMLRNLMEMCITNQFASIKPPDEELQLAVIEKSQIIEFETHLAAATSKVVITEINSLLISQVMLMDPMGVPRRPPKAVLEQLQVLNVSHRLGHLLCRSRKPDLLLEIINRQGTSQSMPWLADLVQSDNGDFSHLPVQCLCEFLLSNSVIISSENTRDIQLISYLQKLLRDENNDHQAACEVLEYFLRRLSSTSKFGRQSAIRGLKLLLKIFQNQAEDDYEDVSESDWLLKYLPTIPCFGYIRPVVIAQLRSACQVENSPELIMIYIQFIASNTLNDQVSEMLEHVMDMALLIVERSAVFASIIPLSVDEENYEDKLSILNCMFVMFNNFIIKMKENKSPTLTLPEYPDLLLVNFNDGTQCHMHLNIIHAFIILLTHSTNLQGAGQQLDFWFPSDAPMAPQAFNVETSEQVQILPDWLKLKMMRSSIERLVDVALMDLSPDQIVLFVQNFGTPINSMSKLLALLDRAVIEDFETVNAVIINKNYLAQFIEIQQLRGAKNGHISIKALEIVDEDVEVTVKSKPIKMLQVLSPATLKSLNISTSEKASLEKGIKPKEIESTLEPILASNQFYKSDVRKFRLLLQKLISKHVTLEDKHAVRGYFFNFLAKVSKSLQSMNVFQNANTCTFFRSLSLFNLMKSEHHAHVQILEGFIKALTHSPHNNNVILQILINQRKMLMQSMPQRVSQIISFHDKERNLHNQLAELMQLPVYDIEKAGKKLLNANLNPGTLSLMIESFTGLLVAKMEGTCKKGVLIDWLVDSADSELVSNQNSQMALLFGKSIQIFRPFLLSLLIHQTNWGTIQIAIEKLLDYANSNIYDPSSVLDFVDAIIRNPKLWQGRDKSISKHEQPEHVLHLKPDQIRTFIDYIMKEDNIIKLAEPPILQSRLCTRVTLMLQCIDSKEMCLKSMIHHVQSQTSIHNRDIKNHFLQQLYINLPPMKFMVNDLPNVYNVNLKHTSSCIADKFSHIILTAISSLSNPRDWQQMSLEMELVLRKLAASHPALLLRELSVLAALLNGRAHMDLHVLRSEHHLALFQQVLGVLELLQPFIFDDVYYSGLHSALNCYFILLGNQFHAKEVSHIMCRMMEFLQSYTSVNPKSAFQLIEPHSELIQYLAANNKNVATLQQLAQGISLLKHKTETSAIDKGKVMVPEDVSQETATAALILAPYSKGDTVPQQWSSLCNHLKKGHCDDIFATLQEIDVISYKKPFLLIDIYDKLIELIFNPSANIRNLAHVLLLRMLKQIPSNPVINSSCFNSYLQCLYSEDINISQSVLEILTDVVLSLQEYATEILQCVFYLGISKNNVYAHLRKTIGAIKFQNAC